MAQTCNISHWQFCNIFVLLRSLYIFQGLITCKDPYYIIASRVVHLEYNRKLPLVSKGIGKFDSVRTLFETGFNPNRFRKEPMTYKSCQQKIRHMFSAAVHHFHNFTSMFSVFWYVTGLNGATLYYALQHSSIPNHAHYL